MDKFREPEQFDAEVEIHDGEPFAVWAPAVNGSHVKAEVYFALLAELESKTDFSDKAIERISGLEKACDKYLRQTKKAERELLAAKERLAELEAKMATPVRLPDIEFVKISGIDFPVMRSDVVKKEIRRAGFKVEGDE